MSNPLPLVGSTLLFAVLVAASYTFAVSLSAAATGRTSSLRAARLGAYGVVGLIGAAVAYLSYALLSHDFAVRYVGQYSDRSMPEIYLLAAFWGGQAGSLLMWLFVLGLYIAVCVLRLGRKHLALQPWVIATLMVVVAFFCVLIAFTANPFAVAAGAQSERLDGDGLNPLLQSVHMLVHPPSLYLGFVGCSIPFAFAIAALASGRLDAEWIQACKKPTLFALLFLGLGNLFGMAWAYEMLGWGGTWAWDPVQNAGLMPFLSLAAFAHSVMIQERRGTLKLWNVFLACLTFVMTVFGTFVNRSGIIASVHAYAQSSIDGYFFVFLGLVVAACATLILYRWPELRGLPEIPRVRKAAITSGWLVIAALGPAMWVVAGKVEGLGAAGRVALFAIILGIAVHVAIHVVFRKMTAGLELRARRPRVESLCSREGMFALSNVTLVGIVFVLLAATTFPLLSELLWSEKISLGPPQYGAFMQPLGLTVFFLMGAGTLLPWKKSSDPAASRAWRKKLWLPALAALIATTLHLLAGGRLGFPVVSATAVIALALCAFNFAVTVQELAALHRTGLRGARRRLGGTLAHLGIVLVFFGLTGRSWNVDSEVSLDPGQSVQVDALTFRYGGMRNVTDGAKRQIVADVKVSSRGEELGSVSPAKVIYDRAPDSPITEPSMLRSLRHDVYLVVGAIDPRTQRASLQIHVNPLVGWIWLGGVFFALGCLVSSWPERRRRPDAG